MTSTKPEAAHPNAQLMQFFTWEHLPKHLQEVSIPFAQLAAHLVENVTPSAELTVSLRKLLESKDAAVRARLLQTQG
jgi:hypothetical protein